MPGKANSEWGVHRQRGQVRVIGHDCCGAGVEEEEDKGAKRPRLRLYQPPPYALRPKRAQAEQRHAVMPREPGSVRW